MYVGDIGDYGKYGLLRAVLPADYKLGVVWYLLPDETHLNDGRHTDYLTKLKFIDCDRHLFSRLNAIISSGERKVSKIERSDIFPDHTVFYSDYLSYDGVPANSPAGRERRLLKRHVWMENALEAIRGCDAVFLDPDNGLETRSVPKHSAMARKYVFYDEVAEFVTTCDTAIIYHHLGRDGTHHNQICRRAEILQDLAGDGCQVVSLLFLPYSRRAYFVITRSEIVVGRVKLFLESPWKQCFQWVSSR